MFLLVNRHNALPGFLGSLVSRHRTEAAAEKAEAKLQRAVKRGHGGTAYLPTVIVSADDVDVGPNGVSRR